MENQALDPWTTSTLPAVQDWRLLAIAVHPEKGAPGRSLQHATVAGGGVVGDRPKKHALLVASDEDVETARAAGGELRANLVVSAPSEVLQRGPGRELTIGDVVVRLDRKPSSCEGMYAEVVVSGDVLVGDRCRLG